MTAPPPLPSPLKVDPQLQVALQESPAAARLRVILVLHPPADDLPLLDPALRGDASPPLTRRAWREARAQAWREAQERAFGEVVQRLTDAGLKIEGDVPGRVLVATGSPPDLLAALDDEAIQAATLDREVVFELGRPR